MNQVPVDQISSAELITEWLRMDSQRTKVIGTITNKEAELNRLTTRIDAVQRRANRGWAVFVSDLAELRFAHNKLPGGLVFRVPHDVPKDTKAELERAGQGLGRTMFV
ncbi:hypothetical protein vseg_015097 [Gypsophila vaccaria]